MKADFSWRKQRATEEDLGNHRDFGSLKAGLDGLLLKMGCLKQQPSDASGKELEKRTGQERS